MKKLRFMRIKEENKLASLREAWFLILPTVKEGSPESAAWINLNTERVCNLHEIKHACTIICNLILLLRRSVFKLSLRDI